LKRLRGTPIIRHDAAWGMIYSPLPPYEILQNRLIPFAAMQRLRRFARYWDLVGNSGNFADTLPLFWADGASPFGEFMRFSDWFHARERRHHGIALARLVESVFDFLVQERGLAAAQVAGALARDHQRTGHQELPPRLRPFVRAEALDSGATGASPRTAHARRQARHRGPDSPPARPGI
jgi:hypothetical protein